MNAYKYQPLDLKKLAMDVDQLYPSATAPTDLSCSQVNETPGIQRLRIFLTDEDENDLQIEESPEEEVVLDDLPGRGKRVKRKKMRIVDKKKIKTKKPLGRRRKKIMEKSLDEKEGSPSSDEHLGSSALALVRRGEDCSLPEEELPSGGLPPGAGGGLKKKAGNHAFKCCHCPYISSWKTNLEKHIMAQHTGERPYRCPHCDYSSVHQCLLEKHWTSHHLGATIHCPDCPFTSQAIETQLKHASSQHGGGGRELSCEVCGRRAVSLSALELHIIEKHGAGGPPGGGGGGGGPPGGGGSANGGSYQRYPCPHCSYSAVLPQNLTSHVQSLHHCSECSFKSESTRELRRHKKKVHRAPRGSKLTDLAGAAATD